MNIEYRNMNTKSRDEMTDETKWTNIIFFSITSHLILQLCPAALPQLYPDRDGRDGLLPGPVPPVRPGAPRQVSGQDQQQKAVLQKEQRARKV